MKFRGPSETQVFRQFQETGVAIVPIQLFDFLIKIGTETYAIDAKSIGERKIHPKYLTIQRSKWYQNSLHFCCRFHLLQIQAAKIFGWKRIMILSMRKQYIKVDLVFENLDFMDQKAINAKTKHSYIPMHKYFNQGVPLEEWIKTKKSISPPSNPSP